MADPKELPLLNRLQTRLMDKAALIKKTLEAQGVRVSFQEVLLFLILENLEDAK